MQCARSRKSYEHTVCTLKRVEEQPWWAIVLIFVLSGKFWPSLEQYKHLASMSYAEAIASWFYLIAWLLCILANTFIILMRLLMTMMMMYKNGFRFFSRVSFCLCCLFSYDVFSRSSFDFITRLFPGHRVCRSFPPCIFKYIQALTTAKQFIHQTLRLCNSIPQYHSNRSFNELNTALRCSSRFGFFSSYSTSSAVVFISRTDIYFILLSSPPPYFSVSLKTFSRVSSLVDLWCGVCAHATTIEFNNEISIEKVNNTSLHLTFAL